MTSLDSFRCCRTLTVGSKTYAYYSLPVAEKNGLKVKPTPTVLEVEQNAMSFKKGETALKAEVDKAIRAMLADGTLTSLSKKWFGSTEDMAAEVRKLGVQ